ncbi:hypothetical protein B0H14DRAFT_2358742, partial [Mycena olivaceomarginata]
FSGAFRDVHAAGIIPKRLGVAEAEWGNDGYSETETIKVGRRDVEIVLPVAIWYPRAVMWAQGLEIMSKFLAVERGDINLL